MTRAANVRLTIAFDGTEYAGWQVQADRTTVQGLLSEALRTLTGEQVSLIGSGRTDAGAHARALVASFRTSSAITPHSFVRALNSLLPDTVRVLAARRAAPAFHAQRSARSKVYRYQIYRGEILPPHLAREHYHFPHPLDIATMREAARLLVGTHDFRGFAKTSSAPVVLGRSTVRSVMRSEIARAGRRLVYTVEADGFLHHMVRNIVGTLVEVGRGRMVPGTVADILREGDRRRAGFTAPARGLILVRVRY